MGVIRKTVISHVFDTYWKSQSHSYVEGTAVVVSERRSDRVDFYAVLSLNEMNSKYGDFASNSGYLRFQLTVYDDTHSSLGSVIGTLSPCSFISTTVYTALLEGTKAPITNLDPYEELVGRFYFSLKVWQNSSSSASTEQVGTSIWSTELAKDITIEPYITAPVSLAKVTDVSLSESNLIFSVDLGQEGNNNPITSRNFQADFYATRQSEKFFYSHYTPVDTSSVTINLENLHKTYPDELKSFIVKVDIETCADDGYASFGEMYTSDTFSYTNSKEIKVYIKELNKTGVLWVNVNGDFKKATTFWDNKDGMFVKRI